MRTYTLYRNKRVLGHIQGFDIKDALNTLDTTHIRFRDITETGFYIASYWIDVRRGLKGDNLTGKRLEKIV